jgi:hypothetical protein
MNTNMKDLDLIASRYEQVAGLLNEDYGEYDTSVKDAEINRDLKMIKGLIDNLQGYLGFKLREQFGYEETSPTGNKYNVKPTGKDQEFGRVVKYLAQHIGPGMLGEWRSHKKHYTERFKE